MSLPVQCDQALCEAAQILADQIAGPQPNAHIKMLALRVAEAQIDLRRVRYARHKLLSDELADPHYESRADRRTKMRVIRRFLTPKLANIPLPAFIEKYLTTTPQGPAKLATILSEGTKQLLVMDRYERRALSRRKFAVRSLDEARRQR